MRAFGELLASWIRKTQGAEIQVRLDDAMDEAVESAVVKSTRDKLAKRASAAIAEDLIHRSTKGSEFVSWLDGVMEKVGEEAGGGWETIVLDGAWLESEDPFVVSARYIGDSQDPDTEVPRYLTHRDLVRMLKQLGGKASCDWQIREIDAGFGRELRTVYSCRVTFPLKTLAVDLFGRPAIEAAADRAVSAHSGAVKKTRAQLDREIASALAARRGGVG
jgi:hypothetical protein